MNSAKRGAILTGYSMTPIPARKRVAAVGVILAAALTARLINLDRGMWVDELITWNAARLSWGAFLADRFEQGHLPLYFIFMRFWTPVAGAHAWALRLPCVALGVWGVYLTYRLGREGYSNRVALAGGAVMAFQALDLWASQTVRMYALMSCMALAASIQLLRLERTGRWRHSAGLFAASVAGLLSQALFAFFMIGQAVYLAWSSRGRIHRQWKALLAMGLGWAMAAPIWIHLARVQHKITLSPKRYTVSLGRMFRYILGAVFGDYETLGLGKWFRAPAALCVLAATACMIWVLLHRGRPLLQRLSIDSAPDEALPGGPSETQNPKPETRNPKLEPPSADSCERAKALTRYLVCWVGVYLTAVFVLSNVIRNQAAYARYYTLIDGAASLAFAAAAFMIPWRTGRRVYCGALTACLALTSAAWWLYPGDGLYRALQMIESSRKPGERVIGCNGVWVGYAYEFYAPKAHRDAFVPLPREEADPQKIENLLIQSDISGAGVWLLAYHLDKSPVLDVARRSKALKIINDVRAGETWTLRLKRNEWQ